MIPIEHPAAASHSQRGGIFFRFLSLLFFFMLLFVLYLVRHPLLRLGGSFWIVDQTPDASDAIVVFGDDNYNADRVTRAAELFKAGRAPRVVASGRYLRPYASIAELEEHDLRDRGVPSSAVIRFSQNAGDTLEEAVAVSKLISAHGWKRILLVTSNYHTRRTQYICDRVFPPGTILRVVAARDSDYDPDKWWFTRRGIEIFTHELGGMFVTMWELRNRNDQTALSAFFASSGAVAVLSSRYRSAGLRARIPIL